MSINNLVLDEQRNIVGTFTETHKTQAENQKRVELIVSMKPQSFRDYEEERRLWEELYSVSNPKE